MLAAATAAVAPPAFVVGGYQTRGRLSLLEEHVRVRDRLYRQRSGVVTAALLYGEEEYTCTGSELVWVAHRLNSQIVTRRARQPGTGPARRPVAHGYRFQLISVLPYVDRWRSSMPLMHCSYSVKIANEVSCGTV